MAVLCLATDERYVFCHRQPPFVLLSFPSARSRSFGISASHPQELRTRSRGLSTYTTTVGVIFSA